MVAKGEAEQLRGQLKGARDALGKVQKELAESLEEARQQGMQCDRLSRRVSDLEAEVPAHTLPSLPLLSPLPRPSESGLLPCLSLLSLLLVLAAMR